MKLLLSSLCVLGLISPPLSGQAAPDFTGTWTMDLTRSESAAQGTPIGPVTVAIRQSPEEVRIDTTRDGTTETVRYLAVAMKPAAAAGESGGTFRWDGSKLVTNLVTYVNNQAVTVQEVRTLNPEATEMAVDVTLVVEHGYSGTSVVRSSTSPNASTGKNVFVKAR